MRIADAVAGLNAAASSVEFSLFVARGDDLELHRYAQGGKTIRRVNKRTSNCCGCIPGLATCAICRT